VLLNLSLHEAIDMELYMSGITDITAEKTRISLIQGDITKQNTEAIVNAANSSLMGGGGVDGAIHRAGGTAILEECRKIVAQIGRLDTGKAVITRGGNLNAKYVIHTVGPIWHGGNRGEVELLSSAYWESLKLAVAYRLKSVSFPSISTGAYGYPLAAAAKVALDAVASFLREKPNELEQVVFVLYDANTYQTYAKALTDLIKV
jgi:O-acetyl-ADP-ribose deacetylase (regulator of RNase III)